MAPATPLWDMAGPLQAPCWIPHCGLRPHTDRLSWPVGRGGEGDPGQGPPPAEPGRWPWALPGLTG